MQLHIIRRTHTQRDKSSKWRLKECNWWWKTEEISNFAPCPILFNLSTNHVLTLVPWLRRWEILSRSSKMTEKKEKNTEYSVVALRYKLEKERAIRNMNIIPFRFPCSVLKKQWKADCCSRVAPTIDKLKPSFSHRVASSSGIMHCIKRKEVYWY